jgi:hypothetical protein
VSDAAHCRRLFELTQRALDGSPARAERMRERRRRPRLATLDQGADGAGPSVDRRSQHDDGGGVDRGKRDAARGCLDAGKRAWSALARSLLTASDAQKPDRASSPTGSGSPGIALLAG